MLRTFLAAGLASLVFAAVLPVPVQAAGPPLKILVGFAPGGSLDALCRLLADPMGKALDRPVVVENRTGAGGQIAAVALKTAAPDGNTVMVANDHIGVIFPLITREPGFDPVADFDPLGQAVTIPGALAVNPATGVRNLAEFATWLQANPDKRAYGVPALGSTPQFAGYIVAKRAGVQLTPVPYRGAAPLAQDLAAGQILIGVGGMSDMIALHREGRLRIIAINGTVRSPQLPEVGTYRESGFAEFDTRTWYGFFAPKGTPAAFVQAFSAALKAGLEDAPTREKLVGLGLDPAFTTPAEMAVSLISGKASWQPIIEASGYEKQ